MDWQRAYQKASEILGERTKERDEMREELKRLREIEAAVKSVDWQPVYDVVTALVDACGEDDPHGMEEYIRWCAALLRQDDKGAIADRLDVIADELGAE